MNLKNYFQSLLWIIIPFLVLILIINTLYYFDFISNNLVKYLKIMATLLSLFLGGFKRGVLSTSKGYINGLKLSSIIIIIIFLLSIILKEFNVADLLYYIIIVMTITFGSMVGISRKKSD